MNPFKIAMLEVIICVCGPMLCDELFVMLLGKLSDHVLANAREKLAERRRAKDCLVLASMGGDILSIQRALEAACAGGPTDNVVMINAWNRLGALQKAKEAIDRTLYFKE